MYYAEEFVKQLYQGRQIVIYGAKIVAVEVASCLMGEPYHLKISNFMVTSLEGNVKKLLGIPVIDIKEGKKHYKDAVVLVAMMEKYLHEVIPLLQKEGFLHVIPMTFESDLWSQLRGNYFRELCLKQGRQYLTLEEEIEKAVCDTNEDSIHDIHMYMVRSHADRQLQADLDAYNWEIPIQAGAALTSRQILQVRDNQGEQISYKNREYCELTALYWIWKNDVSKYAGLCHYRRHFNFDKGLLQKLIVSDIDAVLTIPILNFPDVRTVYANDHIEQDWDIMLQALEKLHPDYRKTAEIVQRGVFYYGYNMFLARKEILDAYCEWLFPILEACEEKCGKKENAYQNRYAGFLAERLMTVYFLHNEEQYKIVHAQKTFLE